MPRTPTLPPTEPAMWRKLLARTHPDTGGDHELFIWTRNLQEAICGREVREEDSPPRSSTPKEGAARVPFDGAFEKAHSFADLTRHALSLADTVDAPYDRLLGLLEDCEEESSTLEGSEAGPAAGVDTSLTWMCRRSGAGFGRTMGG